MLELSKSSAPCAERPRSCPICLSERIGAFCQKGPASYFICRACELIFQFPLPTEAAMRTWADAEYTSGAYQDYVTARAMKIRHFEDRFAAISDRVRPGRLLDIGCSCGYFMEVAASRGYDVQGVEFSRSAIAAADPGIRSRIFEGTLESLPVNGLFDVASVFDLIEHVHEPTELSSSLRNITEARRHPRDQHARHGALSSIPDAIAMADAPADAASEPVLPACARGCAPRRRLRGRDGGYRL